MGNVIDKAVEFFAPGAALRRAHARRVLAYFEAAKPDRLRKNRRETGSGNDAVLRAGSSLRQQARHLEQNYDLALGVLNTLVANVVGANGIGVEPQPRRADGSIHLEFARELLELYKDWSLKPEVTWMHDWPSAQRLMARSWFRDGEVFAQIVEGMNPSLDHGTRVPLSIEMLESDFVPMEMQSVSPLIQQGIEINAWGRAVAFHVSKTNPLESGPISGRGQTKRVSADRMLHLANRHRVRQLRGVSVFASVLNRFDDLKDYEESERIAAKVAASMAAFIKKGTPDLYAPPESGSAEEQMRQMKFRPGMIFDDLKMGEEIGTIDTNRPNPNLETYRSGQLKAIAAGTGPTYSSLSKTYDGTYSAQRQELVEGFVAYQMLSSEFTSRIVRPVYERFIATAILSGAVRVPKDVVSLTVDDAIYITPTMPWIDPAKEVIGLGMQEDRAYMSGPEIIRRRGGNPIDVLEQQARWLQEKNNRGIPVNASVPQPPAPAPAPPEDDDEKKRPGAALAAAITAPMAAMAAGMQAMADRDPPAPNINVHVDGSVINVAQPEIHNHLPEPVINIEATMPAQEAPDVQVNVAAPVVNVAATEVTNQITVEPAAISQIEITAMPTRETKTEVVRDGSGNIRTTTQTESDQG